VRREVQGAFATKLGQCMECDFYQLVCGEEGAQVKSVKALAALS